jgi:hypothetical protein
VRRKDRKKGAKDGTSSAAAGLVSFDVGVAIVAAIVALFLPEPGQVLPLLSTSGIAVLCVVVNAALPCSLIALHGRVTRSDVGAAYRRATAFAIRLVGVIVVLGMWFAIPYGLGKSGIVSEHVDEILFVVGTIAMLSGLLAGFSSMGAAVALGTGAALLGIAFTLPADLVRWMDGVGGSPIVGIGSAVAALCLMIFLGRFVGHLEEMSRSIDAWLARPRCGRLARLAGPFLLAFAMSWWNVLYAGLLVERLDRLSAFFALMALGVVPYRLLRIIAPPVRPLPLITGLIALALSLASLLGR